MKKPTAWSMSALNMYRGCPHSYYLQKIVKIKQPKSQHLLNGIKVHEEAAAFLAGETDIFPRSCVAFRDEFEELRQFKPIVEEKWAFTETLKPTGYFAKNVWLRVSLDACLIYNDDPTVGEVVDHKTGKHREGEYDETMMLYGHTTFAMWPKLQKVTTRLWFLDADVEEVKEYTREECAEAFKPLAEEANEMLNAETYPKKPTGLCKFKPCSKVNGGPCEFG